MHYDQISLHQQIHLYKAFPNAIFLRNSKWKAQLFVKNLKMSWSDFVAPQLQGLCHDHTNKWIIDGQRICIQSLKMVFEWLTSGFSQEETLSTNAPSEWLQLSTTSQLLHCVHRCTGDISSTAASHPGLPHHSTYHSLSVPTLRVPLH